MFIFPQKPPVCFPGQPPMGFIFLSIKVLTLWPVVAQLQAEACHGPDVWCGRARIWTQPLLSACILLSYLASGFWQSSLSRWFQNLFLYPSFKNFQCHISHFCWMSPCGQIAGTSHYMSKIELLIFYTLCVSHHQTDYSPFTHFSWNLVSS